MAVNAIPEGFSTVTPHLVIRDAGKAIDFYKKAFGAEEICRMPGPDGQSVMHAEIKIGNSMIMICEECPEYGAKSPLALGGTPVTVHLYVENAEAAFDKAVKAGAKAEMPVTEMFWGDRYGKVSDPFGHNWSVATHFKDVSPEECAKAAAEMFAKEGGPC